MLVSVHIPKAGGNTFRAAVLEPAFGNRLLLDYDDKPLSVEPSERNARASSFQPPPTLTDHYDCVHGHFLAIKYASIPLPCRFATWFRDPVQQTISRFHYRLRKGLGGEADPETRLADYCRMTKFHNTHASYLWGFDIENFDFIGIVEDYEASLRVFQRQFDIEVPPHITPVNTNPAKGLSDRYRASPEIVRLIRRNNEEDFAIYAAAVRIQKKLQKKYL